MNADFAQDGGWWRHRHAGQWCCPLVMVASLAGCGTTGGFTAQRSRPATVPTSNPAAEINPAVTHPTDVSAIFEQEPLIILQVNFDLLRARVPKGVFSESGKIWNHLDEEAIPADAAAILQRNGLRVARGKLDSWPPIQAILDQEKLETSRSSMMLANGLPLMVDLDQQRRDQTLFLFRRDGTLGGVTCPMSGNRLRIEYEIPVTDASAVMVEVMPEIRQQPTQKPLTVNELGQLDQPVHEPARVLRELAFRMLIPAGEFFVVGPSATAHQGYLAGSLLLCEEIEGRPYETMYFITPRVYRTDRSKKP